MTNPVKKTRGKPTDIDIHVGQRVRLRRILMGLSQGDLAQTLGISFQQIQKYENGTNRLSAGRLYAVSQALDVPVSFFFDGAESNSEPAKRGRANERQTIDVVRNLATLPQYVQDIHRDAIKASVAAWKFMQAKVAAE